MDDKRLIELLQKADQASPAPVGPADLAARVRHLHGRRRASRLTSGALAALVALAVGRSLLTNSPSSLETSDGQDGFARLSGDVCAACVVGDASIVEHLAALVDTQAILVVWTCRGEAATDKRVDGYRQFQLAREQLSSNEAVIWSLFIPAKGVNPIMNPPMLRVRDAAGRTVTWSALPRVTSREELNETLRSARLPGRPAISLADIEWVVGGTCGGA